MTLEEFIEKQKQDLDKFHKEWINQVSNADFDYPDWIDYFWGWEGKKWNREDEW